MNGVKGCCRRRDGFGRRDRDGWGVPSVTRLVRKTACEGQTQEICQRELAMSGTVDSRWRLGENPSYHLSERVDIHSMMISNGDGK